MGLYRQLCARRERAIAPVSRPAYRLRAGLLPGFCGTQKKLPCAQETAAAFAFSKTGPPLMGADPETIQSGVFAVGPFEEIWGWFQPLYRVFGGQDQGPRLAFWAFLWP
ncbi:MAG: hypothetical protein CM15mP21_5210 [Hyphomicrobiales bacterium]|nr:MAG: hypothetical protein CM15mP21_5210 [Hyphomicrobiales bacterium]